MSRNRIEPPIRWREYSTFTANLNLRSLGPGGPATIIKILGAGAGSMCVHEEDSEFFANQLTAFTTGEELLGRFTEIRAEDSKARIPFLTAAAIDGAGGLTDGDTIVFKVDGGGNETATFNTGDFSDISTPTLAELKTVIEADTTAEFNITDPANPILNSPTAGSLGTLQLVSGTGLAKLVAKAVSTDVTTVYNGADTDVTKVRVGWPAQ